jgi:hypothetical protein
LILFIFLVFFYGDDFSPSWQIFLTHSPKFLNFYQQFEKKIILNNMFTDQGNNWRHRRGSYNQQIMQNMFTDQGNNRRHRRGSNVPSTFSLPQTYNLASFPFTRAKPWGPSKTLCFDTFKLRCIIKPINPMEPNNMQFF